MHSRLRGQPLLRPGTHVGGSLTPGHVRLRHRGLGANPLVLGRLWCVWVCERVLCGLCCVWVVGACACLCELQRGGEYCLAGRRTQTGARASGDGVWVRDPPSKKE